MFEVFTADYENYLRDESRKKGFAEAICFPGNDAELASAVTSARKAGKTVTFQGARTGITAGAVPDGGYVINLSRMNGIRALRYECADDSFYVTVQPGVVLSDFRKAIGMRAFDTSHWDERSKEALSLFKEKGPYFFPPDPTETGASLGGMVACNASGARSFLYGSVRKYVHSMRVILSDGDALKLTRGHERAEGREFAVTTENGRRIEGLLPEYSLCGVKNASGYYSMPDMDLVDLFIGSEGTLGVFSEIELKIIRQPEAIYGLMAFFPEERPAIEFVKSVRGAAGSGVDQGSKWLAAVEFFNHDSLKLLMEQKSSNPAFAGLPETDERHHTGVYIEIHGSPDDADRALEMAAETIEACGGDAADTWIAMEEKEMDRLKDFRHAVPEAVNLLIDFIKKEQPGITKLGTDMSVPDPYLAEILDMYNADLREAGLRSVIFGHIGDNHLHVNIIPRSESDYRVGREIYRKWAEKVVSVGGSVSAEHGVGKIKTDMLELMYGKEAIDQMREIKRIFDPGFMFNRGNLFPPV